MLHLSADSAAFNYGKLLKVVVAALNGCFWSVRPTDSVVAILSDLISVLQRILPWQSSFSISCHLIGNIRSLYPLGCRMIDHLQQSFKWWLNEKKMVCVVNHNFLLFLSPSFYFSVTVQSSEEIPNWFGHVLCIPINCGPQCTLFYSDTGW